MVNLQDDMVDQQQMVHSSDD